jgi:hypothetical protein
VLNKFSIRHIVDPKDLSPAIRVQRSQMRIS